MWVDRSSKYLLLGREAVSIYKIPSTSMTPTIASGDLILAEKLTLNIRPPYVHMYVCTQQHLGNESMHTIFFAVYTYAHFQWVARPL